MAGMVAGLALVAEEMVATVLLGGSASDPFRLVASVAFGRQALSPDFPLWIPVLVGALAHGVLSVLFGLLFVLLVAGAYQLSARVPLLLVYGVLYGLALWELNILTVLHLLFPQVAPLFGLANQLWNGIVAYAIFYGLVLGAYVAFARPAVVADWKRSGRASAGTSRRG
jgi:Conserved membrane protein YqhR